MIPPFSIGGDTVTYSATTTSGTTSRAAMGIKATPPGSQVIVQAASANTVPVFIKFGASDVVATTAGFPMLPGAIHVFSVGQGQTHMAAITALTTGTVYVTPGMGI